MLYSRRLPRLAAVFAGLAFAAACNDPGSPRPSGPGLQVSLSGVDGALAVAVTSMGSDIDPDGYLIRVDGSPFQRIDADGLVTFTGLSGGDHRVDLYGVAANCWAMGYDPDVVNVTAGVAGATRFDMGCGAQGSVYVSTSTTGVDLDADGYTLTVDGSSQPIATNDSAWLNGLSSYGSHSVALSGVSGNCMVSGPSPATVAVSSGGTASMTFSVGCAASGNGTGTLTVTTATTGSNPDPDGYTLIIDGTISQPIGLNDTVTFSGAAGAHPVRLSVAPNCTVDGANPRTVTVTPDGADTTTFSVTCGALLARVAGQGQLKYGPLTAGSFVQTIEFDVRADLTGWFRLTDYADTHGDGTVGRWIIDPIADPETAFTAYRNGSSACSDPSRGVELDAVGREEDHRALRIITVELCDNGPPGNGTDFLSFLTSGKYGRSGILTSGDITKR